MFGLAAALYAVMAALGVLGMLARGLSPLGAPTGSSVIVAAGAGAALGVAAVAATRAMTARWAWARALADDLAPAARLLPARTVVLTALASGVAEELFFRGALVAWLGVVPSALAFGLLHQVRGASRWRWAAFAAVMGLLLGGLYVATGSLLAPIVAHVVVNAANLRWLRSLPARSGREGAPARRLGGLLAR